jgi:cytochrome c553
MMEISMVRCTVLVSVVLAACGGDVPANPTWFDDVQPILRANCARCHGADPSSPKISKFRLDRYVKDDAATFDAWDYAQASGGSSAPMVAVAVDHETPAMPPDYSLTDRQRDILARWSEQGAPKGARSNQVPEIELVSPQGATTADQSLDLSIRSWDPDLDGLVVQLWAHDLATTGADQDLPLGAPVGGGLRAATVDTGQLASKHGFEIYANLDDGFADDPTQNQTRATVIPSLAVDHGARGTAPTVKLVAPNGGEALIGTTTITWTASDPDAGDTVTIDLALIAVASDGTETMTAAIASGLANTGSYAWMIPSTIPATDGAGAAIPYRIRVTGTDALGMPRNVRSDESDGTVTLAQATTTTLTWADVKPIFATYCLACHGQPAKTAALDYFRLDKYNAADPVAPINGDQGAYEMRSTIYTRLVVQANMPPAAQPQPSAQDRQKIGDWILGGAPEGGGGPTDQQPTFTWTAPSATQSSGATVTLTWMASDAEGLMSGKLEYVKANGVPTSGCPPLNPTWATVTDPKATATLSGALTWSDSFVWTLPSTTTGYYCFRGSVTDTANQTVTVNNLFGVK